MTNLLGSINRGNYKTYLILGLSILLVLALIGWAETAKTGATSLERELEYCGRTGAEAVDRCQDATANLRSAISKYSQTLQRSNPAVENENVRRIPVNVEDIQNGTIQLDASNLQN